MPKKKEQPKTKNLVSLLVDRSGSMSGCRSGTIEGINSYVTKLQQDKDNEYFLSITIFDSEGIDRVFNAPISEFKPWGFEDFVPRGGTPLYDAIGKTVATTETEADENTAVTLVIVTDGGENESKEFNSEQIVALLAQKEKQYFWVVVYLGANQDAFATARVIGASNAVNYNTSNIKDVFAGVGHTTRQRTIANAMYGASASASMNYSASTAANIAAFTAGDALNDPTDMTSLLPDLTIGGKHDKKKKKDLTTPVS